jgi:hypothetical protein
LHFWKKKFIDPSTLQRKMAQKGKSVSVGAEDKETRQTSETEKEKEKENELIKPLRKRKATSFVTIVDEKEREVLSSDEEEEENIDDEDENEEEDDGNTNKNETTRDNVRINSDDDEATAAQKRARKRARAEARAMRREEIQTSKNFKKNVLKVVLENQQGDSMCLNLEPSALFRNIMRAYADKCNLNQEIMQFLYEGKRIQETDTLQTLITKLGFESGDIINVTLTQTGGGSWQSS